MRKFKERVGEKAPPETMYLRTDEEGGNRKMRRAKAKKKKAKKS